MSDQNDDQHQPYKPLGSDLTTSQQRMTPISEERKQLHALEHIARVLDRIDAKLDKALSDKKPD